MPITAEERRLVQERLRGLMSRADGMIEQARRERREMSADERATFSQCLGEIDGLALRLGTPLDDHPTLDEKRQALRPQGRPEDDGLDYHPETRTVPIEDRSVYDGWPVEEADQFLRCVVGMSTSRQLPGGIHSELAETFIHGPEYRDQPTGQGGVELDTGGFLVPATLADTILQKTFSQGQILSRVREVPVTVGKTVTWPAITESSRKVGEGKRFGGIQVYRTAEAAAATKSKLKLQQVCLELKKQTALLYATEEILEDATQMATLILELTPQAFTFHIEQEIIRGAGGPEMQGILTAPAKIAVVAEGGQSADTVVAENLLEMERRLAPGSMGNSVVLCNQNVLPQLRKLFIALGTGGVPLYLPPSGLAGAPYGTILGRPLVVSEHCSTLGDEGDVIWADFSQYLYARKGGLKTVQSIHVKFVEGETAFRFIMRNDGKPWWASPLAPAQGDDTADTVSPFVTIAART